LSRSSKTLWLLFMLIILLTNGMSAFGLRVLSAWGLPSNTKFSYLTVWYAAGFACIAIPMLLRGVRGGLKEAGWGGLIAVLSICGQIAMANALNSGLPGNVVFPVTIGGSLLVVALAGRLFFGEKMRALSWTGVAIGSLAIILLSVS
jgi:drug/metabolite transporter (DMT)-like permease